MEETSTPETLVTIFQAQDTTDALATIIYELYSDSREDLPVYVDRYSGQFLTLMSLLGKNGSVYDITVVATNMQTAENMREIIQLKIVAAKEITKPTTEPPDITSAVATTTPTLLFPSAQVLIDSLNDITMEKLDSLADAVEAMALAALQDVKVILMRNILQYSKYKFNQFSSQIYIYRGSTSQVEPVLGIFYSSR